jgi:hypothetical protein
LATVTCYATLVVVIAETESQGQITLDVVSAGVEASFGGEIRLTDGSGRLLSEPGISEASPDLSTPFVVDLTDSRSISRNGVTLQSTVTVQQDTSLTVTEENFALNASLLGRVQNMISGDEAALVSATGGSTALSFLQMIVQLDSPAVLLINGAMSIDRMPGPIDPDTGGDIYTLFVFGRGNDPQWVVFLGSSDGPSTAPINVSARIPAGEYILEAYSYAALIHSPPLEDTKSMLDFTMSLTAVPPDFRWVNTTGGFFHTASNWSDGVVPQVDDTARVDVGGTYTISLTENVANDRFLVGGGTTGVARPTLELNGHQMESRELSVTGLSGHLVVDGTDPGSHVSTDNVFVDFDGHISGAAWFRPRSGGSLEFENGANLSLGFTDQPTPVRTVYTNSSGGPEPAQFTAHMAVRGNFTQTETGTMNVVLTPQKAVKQALVTGPSTTSTELFVTGAASLDGYLNVQGSPDHFPQHGESYNLIQGVSQITRGFDSDKIQLPLAHNLEHMILIQKPKGIRAVVPQKVIFAWGHDAPVTVLEFPLFDRILARTVPGSEEAFAPEPADAAAFESYKRDVIAYVQDQFQVPSDGVNGDPAYPGLEAIVFKAGEPEQDSINLFLTPPKFVMVGGLAYTGLDRFNREAHGEAIVSVYFGNASTALDERVAATAEIATHEIAHLLGLRHINPPGVTAVMDYDQSPGVVERFTTGPYAAMEPPREGGQVSDIDHNPAYHLLRYVDGYSNEELFASGFFNGLWDRTTFGNRSLQVSADLSSSSPAAGDGSELLLYNVLVAVDQGNDILTALSEFDQITLADLARESFELSELDGFGIFASSTPNGEYDIALASGNPFEGESLMLVPGAGQLQGLLQKEADNASGYETLAEIMLTVSFIPATIPGDYNSDGVVDAADYVVWRDGLGTIYSQADYEVWRASFGQTAGGVSAGDSLANGTAPESASAVLLLAAVFAASHFIRWRRVAPMQRCPQTLTASSGR